mmetsp:Transcript_1786/g.5317  ORF Transcript_1786/g.5317 Transcript_1786/m.5317 type:complete len:221 (+) Transcript_1786:28-690(+)
MFAATKALVVQAEALRTEEAGLDFAGDFETTGVVGENGALSLLQDDDDDDDDENPFGAPPPVTTTQSAIGGDSALPLLRATRDILEGGERDLFPGAPAELAPVFAAATDALCTADLEFDRLMLDRALAAKDWIRAKLAAHRILADRRDAPPEHVAELRRRVAVSTVATPDDRRAFDRAVADADWTMADLLGSQILHFSDAAVEPLVERVVAESGGVLVDV